MIRNREFRWYAGTCALITVIGTVVCFIISVNAGFITLVVSAILLLANLLFTRWRYRQIEELSRYLKRIAEGDYNLDVRDNEEGELSILKSEIYKVTVMLREQADLLEKDKRFLADAISDISHQLKTPITSMTVMTELLRDENLPPERRRDFTRSIHSQLERLQWLVTSLLKLSKIDAGAVEFKKEKIVVRDLIRKASEHLRIPMEIKEQTFEVTGDSAVHFTGDFNWTSEAMANILKNCMEHTPIGGRIGVDYSQTSIYTMIRIYDNGEGIHKEDLPYIFNRFYKGKNAGPDSIGIGLAMSKSIIENQNGRIEVKSVLSKGTEFTVKFYHQVV